MKKLSTLTRSLLTGAVALTMSFGLMTNAFAASPTSGSDATSSADITSVDIVPPTPDQLTGEIITGVPAPTPEFETLAPPLAPEPLKPIYEDPAELREKFFMYDVVSYGFSDDGCFYIDYRYSNAGKLCLLMPEIEMLRSLEENLRIMQAVSATEKIDLSKLTGKVSHYHDERGDGLYESTAKPVNMTACDAVREVLTKLYGNDPTAPDYSKANIAELIKAAKAVVESKSYKALMTAAEPLLGQEISACKLCAVYSDTELAQLYAEIREVAYDFLGDFIEDLEAMGLCEMFVPGVKPCG